MSVYYTATIFISVAAMIVMEICVFSNDMMSKDNKKLFEALFFMTALASMCEWGGNAMQGTMPQLRIMHIILKTVELMIVPFIPLFISHVFTRSKILKIAMVIAIFHAVLVVLSSFAGFIFYVDSFNTYYHGSFYVIYITMYLAAYVICLYSALSYVLRYQYGGSVFVISIFVFFFLGMIATMVVDELQIDFIVLSIADVMIYIVNSEAIQQTDALTGLVNRMGYESYMQQQRSPCVVLFFDVDEFKGINDTYGHSYGDFCLREISRVIMKCFKAKGKCFRIGGDEFCVIYKGTYEEASATLGDFGKAMKQARTRIKGKSENIPSVSVGYARFDPLTSSMQDAVNEADEMMYKAKKSRKETK